EADAREAAAPSRIDAQLQTATSRVLDRVRAVAEPSAADPAAAPHEVSFATNLDFEKEVLTRVSPQVRARAAGPATQAVTRVRRARRRPLSRMGAGLRVVAGSAVVLARSGSPPGDLELTAPRVASWPRLGEPAPIPAAALQPPAPRAAPTMTAQPTRHSLHKAAAPLALGTEHDAARTTAAAGGATREAGADERAASGTLTLNAVPWATFFLDGEQLADCPVKERPVTAGRHRVRIVCPDKNERTQALTVAAGGRERQVFDCNQPG